MKAIKFTALGILAASSMLFTACFDLEEQAFSEIITENIEFGDNELASMVSSGYGNLSYILGWQGLFDSQEEAADVIITPTRPNGWDDGGTYKRMHRHTWSNEEWQPANTYETAFEAINFCNRILTQIEAGDIPVAEDTRARYVPELRALRALWYSLLLDQHGNVPIVTKFSTEVPTQSTRKEVYEFVVKELTEVLDAGTVTKEKTYSTLNHWSIEMLLMRVYLNAEVYAGVKAYDKALKLAEDIIENSPYSLSATYAENFAVDLGPSNTEVIFAVVYDELQGVIHSQCRKWYPPVSKNYFGWGFQCWGGNCCNPQFYNSYQEGDRRKEDTWFHGPMVAADGKLVWTCLNYLPSVSCNPADSGVGEGQDCTSIDFGLRQKKYEPDVNGIYYWDNDFPYFRLAEAYYTAAECILRGETGKKSAAEYVNAVRSRSVSTPITDAELRADTKMVYGLVPWGALTYADIQKYNGTHDWSPIADKLEASQANDKIIRSGHDTDPVELGGMYDEWGWEFALECQRRTQMIRFGTFSNRNWFNKPAIDDTHDQLFPIPLWILQDNPNLKQNPGYAGL